jgi:hypothetical protein
VLPICTSSQEKLGKKIGEIPVTTRDRVSPQQEYGLSASA